MPYMIETFDKKELGAVRSEQRQAHLAYLEANATLLLACGAKLSDDGATANGGLYLVDVESRAEAERFIEADPFHQAGLFQRVKIQRWRQAYLAGRNTL